MKKEPPICQRSPKWLKHHCGEHALAPLTRQDAKALSAFAHLMELYAAGDANGERCALEAMRATVRAMQPSVRHLAKRLIPQSLDWGDEEPLLAKNHGEVRMTNWFDVDKAVRAMAATARAMQPSVRHLAKRLIPQSLDWGDEEPLWRQIVPALPFFEVTFTKEKSK